MKAKKTGAMPMKAHYLHSLIALGSILLPTAAGAGTTNGTFAPPPSWSAPAKQQAKHPAKQTAKASPSGAGSKSANKAASSSTSPEPKTTGGSGAAPAHIPPAVMEALDQMAQYDKAGDAAVKSGDLPSAKYDYEQALAIVPLDGFAQRGMAHVLTAEGDIAGALDYYRQDIYVQAVHNAGSIPGDWSEGDAAEMMKYVILLSQTGQAAEALHVYAHAAELFNSDPSNNVKLPDFGDGSSATDYTPSRLQAMAHDAIGREEQGHLDTEAPNEFQAAVTLAPESGVAHYYWGECLLRRDVTTAKAELQKAIDLGDDNTVAKAKLLMQIAR